MINLFFHHCFTAVDARRDGRARASAVGIDEPRELEKLVPGLRLVTAIPFLTMPELVGRLAYSRSQALLYGVLERCGWYRRSMLHLRYEF
ncbi:MAG: hypothetical protein JXA08_09590 [Methanomicrobiaceae archaeon]|nr:hypothetical protein [Methanomicrobiaceae archaeon]